ncbi:MAG TPA: hypothetical protein PKE06_23235 [Flavilitoribacter sp.]|nr:hypothetical protein [Flavilitoribacter sp.]HMQ88247.1 hypothetical protein [Flavilitoribacter sp.]
MANQLKDEIPGITWDEEKKEFARQVFAQARIFMERDNEMIGHFTVFTGTVTTYIKENPDFLSKIQNRSAGLSGEGAARDGRNFWDDLQHIIDAFEQITSIVREDKKFFAELLSQIFGW